MKNYEQVKEEDHLAETALCLPGRTVGAFDIVSRSELKDTRLYKDHITRYGMEEALCTAIGNLYLLDYRNLTTHRIKRLRGTNS